jgi:hypothetical protein
MLACASRSTENLYDGHGGASGQYRALIGAARSGFATGGSSFIETTAPPSSRRLVRFEYADDVHGARWSVNPLDSHWSQFALSGGQKRT